MPRTYLFSSARSSDCGGCWRVLVGRMASQEVGGTIFKLGGARPFKPRARPAAHPRTHLAWCEELSHLFLPRTIQEYNIIRARQGDAAVKVNMGARTTATGGGPFDLLHLPRALLQQFGGGVAGLSRVPPALAASALPTAFALGSCYLKSDIQRCHDWLFVACLLVGHGARVRCCWARAPPEARGPSMHVEDVYGRGRTYILRSIYVS